MMRRHAPEQDFLYVGTVNSASYVCGGAAAWDATALEDAGVRVYRHDKAAVSHGNAKSKSKQPFQDLRRKR